jgi:hypothetical protein
VAQRAPDEVERVRELILKEGLFSWCPPQKQPSELTDKMVADAENALRLKLPASLLAILKMQNGGYPCKCQYHPHYVPLRELCGIAPGCKTVFSLQEMPEEIWALFERFLDAANYREWWDTFGVVPGVVPGTPYLSPPALMRS